MYHGRGEGGPGAAKNLLRNPILLGQCLIGGIGNGVDGQQRNVTFPDYDPLVDLVIPREGARVVAWPFGAALDVAVVVGCSGTAGGTATAAVLLAAPRRQLLYAYVLIFFNSTSIALDSPEVNTSSSTSHKALQSRTVEPTATTTYAKTE